MEWKKVAIFFLPLILALLAGIVWFFIRRTIRTRLRMERQLHDDPDINEWLVVFNWSRKIIYVPTVIVSLLGSLLMLLKETGLWSSLDGSIVGGAWLAVFVVNFLMDEYEISLKILLIAILAILVLFLWLSLLEWVWPFLRMFAHLHVTISSAGYLVLALLMLAAIGISWLKGLFYYAALTHNYVDIQSGPTETSEQVNRENFSTRIDTGDFLERLLGFGHIVITFHDGRRPPMVLLVSGIGKKAAKLESLRGKLAIDTTPTDGLEAGGAPPSAPKNP